MHTEIHTHWGSQRDNWGIVGSRHVTGCVYKRVSQTLFLDGHINSRPSLPRHRHAAHSCSWQSHRSHLRFSSVCADFVIISHHHRFTLFSFFHSVLLSSDLLSFLCPLSPTLLTTQLNALQTYQPLVVSTDPIAADKKLDTHPTFVLNN